MRHRLFALQFSKLNWASSFPARLSRGPDPRPRWIRSWFLVHESLTPVWRARRHTGRLGASHRQVRGALVQIGCEQLLLTHRLKQHTTQIVQRIKGQLFRGAGMAEQHKEQHKQEHCTLKTCDVQRRVNALAISQSSACYSREVD